MAIEYEIDEEFGGVPEGWKFEIDDTPEEESGLKVLLAAFEIEFIANNIGRVHSHVRASFAKKLQQLCRGHVQEREIKRGITSCCCEDQLCLEAKSTFGPNA